MLTVEEIMFILFYTFILRYISKTKTNFSFVLGSFFNRFSVRHTFLWNFMVLDLILMGGSCSMEFIVL